MPVRASSNSETTSCAAALNAKEDTTGGEGNSRVGWTGPYFSFFFFFFFFFFLFFFLIVESEW